jgi:ABC-type glycerol-3-phosphate transport system substrate-binding protein
MKKLCAVMCIVLLCAGTLLAGGKQEAVAEKTGVSITLSSPEESYPKDLLDVLASLYMQKNPGITIVTETFAGVPQIEYYKAKFATGDLPDVFFMNALDVGFVNAGAYMELPADIIEAAPDTAYNAFKGKFYQVINNQQVGECSTIKRYSPISVSLFPRHRLSSKQPARRSRQPGSSP